MFKKLTTLFFLTIFHLASFSQEISNKSISGIWEVREVQLDSNVFDASNIHNFDKNASFFKGAKFMFSKNGLTRIESIENVFAPFNQAVINTTFYFYVENNTISVGRWKKASNILYLQVKQENECLLLNFSGGLLKLHKLENNCKLKMNKEALKTKTALIKQKPLIQYNIGDESILEQNIDQPIKTYNCSHIEDEKLLKQCVSHTIMWFFNRKFNTDIASEIGLSGRLENKISFIIDSNGNAVNIEVESINTQLSDEVKKTINLLPKFIPAKQKGIPINTKYSFPFIFQIQD